MVHEITDDYPPFEAIIRDKLGNQIKIKAEWMSLEEIKKFNEIKQSEEETGWDVVRKRAALVFGNEIDFSKFKPQTIIKIINLYFNEMQKNPTENLPEISRN